MDTADENIKIKKAAKEIFILSGHYTESHYNTCSFNSDYTFQITSF